MSEKESDGGDGWAVSAVGKKEKGRILDEFTVLTGYDRCVPEK